MNKNKIFIKNLFESVLSKLNSNDNIWMSIDLVSIISILNIRKKDEIKETLKILEYFIENFSKNLNNLLIPSFCFEFPDKKRFDTQFSKPLPKLGSLPNYLFKKNYGYRTLHPFYSFYVFGNNKLNFILKSQEFTDSVGENSIFNYINLNKYKLISIGHHYTSALSSIHQCEYSLGVSYRSKIFFNGILIDKNRNISKNGNFNFYGRNREICDFSGLTINGAHQLKNSNISSQYLFFYKNSSIGYYLLELDKFNEYILKNHNKNNILFDYIPKIQKKEFEVINTNLSSNLYKKFILEKSLKSL